MAGLGGILGPLQVSMGEGDTQLRCHAAQESQGAGLPRKEAPVLVPLVLQAQGHRYGGAELHEAGEDAVSLAGIEEGVGQIYEYLGLPQESGLPHAGDEQLLGVLAVDIAACHETGQGVVEDGDIRELLLQKGVIRPLGALLQLPGDTPPCLNTEMRSPTLPEKPERAETEP